MHEVFISYSFDDKVIADKICHYFEENGIRCWYAPRDVKPSMDYRAAIMDAIEKSKCFVLVYTQKSNQSQDVGNEVAAAFKASCPVIPLRIEDVEMAPALAYHLNSVHWLDAINPPLQKHIGNLFQIVSGIVRSGDVQKTVPQIDRRKESNSVRKALYLLIPVLLCLLLGVLFGKKAKNVFMEKFSSEEIEHSMIEEKSEEIETEEEPEGFVSTFSLRNTSNAYKNYVYPFYAMAMYSQEGEEFFLQNLEDKKLYLFKADTGYPLLSEGISYPEECFDYMYMFMTNHSDFIYFVEFSADPDTWQVSITIKCYNKNLEKWVNEEGTKILLDENEEFLDCVRNFKYMDGKNDHEDELLLFIKDIHTGCAASVIRIYPDGQSEKKDISAYELTEFVAGTDKAGEHFVLFLNKSNRVIPFDCTNLEMMEMTEEVLKEEYLAYAISNNQSLSKNKKYYRRNEQRGTKETVVTIWDLETSKKVFDEGFTKNFHVSFIGENEVIVFNQENGSLSKYFLKSGMNQTKREIILYKEDYLKEDAFGGEIPVQCCYLENMDLLCFVVEKENKKKGGTICYLVLTTLDGEVKMISEEMKGYESGTYIYDFAASDDLFYFVILGNDPGVKLEEGVSTMIYSSLYTMKSNGEIKFVER